MTCLVCDPEKRRYCETGQRLVSEVRERFDAMVDWVGKTGEASITRAKSYEQARDKLRAHVGEADG